jgi:hypothetical protein
MQLRYTKDELLASHAYVAPHMAAGQLLHGGLDAAGRYVPPRTLHRTRAVGAWADALRARGGTPLPAGPELLAGPRFPSYAQHRWLLERRLTQTLWNHLTTVGRVEARGRALAVAPAPSFARLVVEDISDWTVGHLGEGLFIAHGQDEGGEPERGIGGHDAMWFAVRDLALGAKRHPVPDPDAANATVAALGTTASRWMPDLSERYEQILRFLMNLLMVELRAYIVFDQNERLLSEPSLLDTPPDDVALAAELVRRIRSDEAVHVAYLQNVLGELGSATLRCADGSTRPGAEIIDPAWTRQVDLSVRVQPERQRAAMRETLRARITDQAGTAAWEAFDAMSEA